MLRVANVIEEGKVGGPQVVMVRVAAALSDRAETLIVMPHENSKPFRRMCEAYGVAYRTRALTRITKQWRAAAAYILLSPWEVVGLARFFRREQFSLVHVAGGSWQYKALLAAWLARVPSVWTLNDSYVPGWIRVLFKLGAPLASGFIFASYRSQEYYGVLIREGQPQAVVPSTVDTAIFDPVSVIAADLDIKSNAFLIGTVANVSRVKGLETLIQAAARVSAMGYAVRLVIIGAIAESQHHYHRRLKALADELGLAGVHFCGPLTDVRPVLKRLDVYCCSSIAESSPVSVWEAMAMARPIVSTDVGDVARHVDDGESGFIVPVADDAAMADRIARLLDDPDWRARMGAAARDAAQAFRPAEVARLTLDIYQRALHRIQPYSSQ